MGEFGSPATNTHTHHHNNHRLHQFPFTVGSEIEVSIDEEGFKGALFKATILKLPTTFSPSKRKKALVEYKTLVTEDGSSPLKEQVDALSLRPLPPDTADKDFEECDIVDATDKDGWWTGVVCKALEDGGYSVFFKNPMHVMDFQRNHLRLHQDWVDGKWVVPRKMDASLLRDQLSIISEDANVPENVEHESLKNNETNNGKENSYTVNSRNDLMEKPSIYDESPASFALTSSKRRRSLTSKSRVSNPLKRLREGVILGTPAADRSRMIDKTSRGKAFSKSATPNKDRRRRRSYLNFHGDDDSASPNRSGIPKGGKKPRTKEDVDGSDKLKEQVLSFINGNKGNTYKRSQRTQVTDKERKEGYDVIDLETISKDVTTNNESERNKHLAPDEQQTPVKISLDVVGDGEENSNNQTKEKGMEPEQQEATENSDRRKRGRPRKITQEIEQQQASKNSYKRKRGRPRKLMLVPTTAEDSNQDGSLWKPEKATLKSSVTAKRTKRKKGFRKMPMYFVDFQDLNRRNGSEISAYKTNGSGTNSVDDDDRPLLMWLGGIQGSANNNALKLGQASGSIAKRRTKGSERVDAMNEVRRVDRMPEHEVDKNRDWPFVKNSPVWSAIDSLEVFKHIPQKPHFQPLSTYKEECREGLAIGCMVTFASLVEKVTKLQFSYPRHIFESTLASLYELEQHGFNISMLCNRVNELLFIKDSEVRYAEETKVAENKILEYIENKTKLAEERHAIEQKITELQKRQASIKQEMETTDHEIDALQSHVETIRECTTNTKLHFENQIALPLWPV
ncbi:DUF724 domain-containing protein 3-like isoform X2 [Cucumis melo]|uniref:Uncharacterized protein LOC103492739 isoform X1 n=1 Tax=Cucumis melo TaxID=3656 RepID=A0A1S3BSB2_CUCME|nr:DUF724 domain-containing protein 3-like isoform X2 [Cucumis melo]